MTTARHSPLFKCKHVSSSDWETCFLQELRPRSGSHIVVSRSIIEFDHGLISEISCDDTTWLYDLHVMHGGYYIFVFPINRNLREVAREMIAMDELRSLIFLDLPAHDRILIDAALASNNLPTIVAAIETMR